MNGVPSGCDSVRRRWEQAEKQAEFVSLGGQWHSEGCVVRCYLPQLWKTQLLFDEMLGFHELIERC